VWYTFKKIHPKKTNANIYNTYKQESNSLSITKQKDIMQKLSCKKTCINQHNFFLKQLKQTTNKDGKEKHKMKITNLLQKNGGNCHHEKLLKSIKCKKR
jgi:superoxide dismutase